MNRNRLAQAVEDGLEDAGIEAQEDIVEVIVQRILEAFPEGEA